MILISSTFQTSRFGPHNKGRAPLTLATCAVWKAAFVSNKARARKSQRPPPLPPTLSDYGEGQQNNDDQGVLLHLQQGRSSPMRPQHSVGVAAAEALPAAGGARLLSFGKLR
jgi:hypothetical protein